MWKLQHRGERRITSPRRHCSVVQSDTWVEKFFALSWHLGSSHHQAQHITGLKWLPPEPTDATMHRIESGCLVA